MGGELFSPQDSGNLGRQYPRIGGAPASSAELEERDETAGVERTGQAQGHRRGRVLLEELRKVAGLDPRMKLMPPERDQRGTRPGQLRPFHTQPRVDLDPSASPIRRGTGALD